ncbi:MULTISPECIES: hypothetical protein [unclassified Streptomyces]|uniref:hypothetical protein n=1 Tax=unclassified Streptomyces TaxID=2593676 RepID=UPI002DD8D8DC|nr:MULTISPECIES: hypothetical protein [unclassified Streptomyces]WSC46470.1 hypothetical protein OIE61_22370 [Streptomyces sp. NBC_01762]WSD26122.1 hypothetical protein OHA26_23060 [Streptomyces sp. NBC_01751]
MPTRKLLATIALIALPLGTACTAAPQATAPSPSAPATTTSPEPVSDPTTETPAYADPSPSDFTMKFKIKRKHCFGSAGCNVDVEPDLSYKGILSIDPDKSYEITYQINGDESGPVIETISLTNGTSMEYYPSSLSTASSRTKITGKVTDVAETN